MLFVELRSFFLTQFFFSLIVTQNVNFSLYIFCFNLPTQLQVDIKVETTDKGGNFIGWLFVDGVNLSQALVEQGLAKVHFTAERSVYYPALLKAEQAAKEKKLNVSLYFNTLLMPSHFF